MKSLKWEIKMPAINLNQIFSKNSLPYGIFKPDSENNFRVGVALGEQILDLAGLETMQFIDSGTDKPVFSQGSLNAFMALGFECWRDVRQQLLELVNEKLDKIPKKVIYNQCDCELKLPFEVSDYTDFFSSWQHAYNLGKMFRPNGSAVLPSWNKIPLAYHGRSSSIIVSGTPLKRPCGQILNNININQFSATNALDFEVEFGFVIGTGNSQGTSIKTDDAYQHVFGAVILNDWSARDIQKFEYVPLGPFLGKSFATSISPWVMSIFALQESFMDAPAQQPEIEGYLKDSNRKLFDIELCVYFKTQELQAYQKIAVTNTRYSYWSLPQLIAHHTINGCNLKTGDILATGTLSGPELHQFGSMIELSWGGEKPLEVTADIKRSFLENGDSVLIEGTLLSNGQPLFGMGFVEGTILPENK